MTAVFIAGSRAISRLSSEITDRLDNIVRRNLMVLIGDANGADKAVQQYLAKRGYRNVLVYCMDACRNNLGNWPVRQKHVESTTRRDRHYYGIKDIAMANEATCGFMLWDGRSKGTLTNVMNLLGGKKKVLLYLRPKKRFFTLASFNDLYLPLHELGIQDVSRFVGSLGKNEATALPLARSG